MRTRALFVQPAFGWRLGSGVVVKNAVPFRTVRRPSLGFTPTGEVPTAECTQYGTRMIQEQDGYTPIGCPTGPDCYDIIDMVTGTVVIKNNKGPMSWVPQCGQWGYANPGEAGECPSGQGKINGQCGEFAIACPNPDGTYALLEAIRDASGAVTGLTGRDFGSVPGDQVQLMSRVGARPPNEPWCQPQPQSQQPEPEPEPEPEPMTQPVEREGPVPISIDIQAYTPAYWEAMQSGQPIPTSRPIPTSTPTQPPVRQQPLPQAPKLPPAPETKSNLTTVGLAAGLVAAAAIALSAFK